MDIQVLVVEPDPACRDTLRAHLQRNQIDMSVLYGAEALERRLALEYPSAIVLRHDLPANDGLSVLRRLRETGCLLPVIVISRSDDVVDKVLAFEIGANDYVVDPFDARELLARLRHALRCSPALPRIPRDYKPIVFDNFELAPAGARLLKHGKEIAASPLEFSVLTVLASNRMRVMSRPCILSQLDRRSKLNERSLNVIVCRLRKLLGTSPSGRQYIQTRYGDGYIFCSDDAFPDFSSADEFDTPCETDTGTAYRAGSSAHSRVVPS
ncbi:response regulator transcription factor [Paraburkholderia sp. B3]|uniref:response regulator transcription factor n=1 Tax=Paraburkholderia sp. B3 TaxID=3134791 RepID=UPI0039828C19